MSQPRLRDVAQRASVSMTTASIVLRRLPGARVSAETRARVNRAADELGYQPRERNRVFRLVALSLDVNGSQDSAPFLAAAMREAWRRDHLLVLLPSADEPRESSSLSLDGATGQIDGIVHVGARHDLVAHPHLAERTVTVCLASATDSRGNGKGATVVVRPDDRDAARRLGAALANAGHRRVAILANGGEALTADRWREGLADGLGTPPPDIAILDPSTWVEHADEGAGEARRGSDDFVTALVCMSDCSALTTAALASVRHLDVAPDAVILVRGGAARNGVPGTVRSTGLPLPTQELARAAVTAALGGRDEVSNEAAEPGVVMVPFPLPAGLTIPTPPGGASR